MAKLYCPQCDATYDQVKKEEAYCTRAPYHKTRKPLKMKEK